jgi:hypothetical protein
VLQIILKKIISGALEDRYFGRCSFSNKKRRRKGELKSSFLLELDITEILASRRYGTVW